MRKAAWVFAVMFGLVFLGAALLNADLLAKSRATLAATGLGETASARKWQLLVILPDSDDSFFQGLLEGLSAGAQAADVAVQVERYPNSSPAEAGTWFDIGLGARVDGIVMYASRNDDLNERAGLAAKAGVAFVAVGKDPPPGRPPCFIGSASLFQGYEGGRIIASRLGGRARIGLILPQAGPSTGEAPGRPSDDPLYRGLEASIERVAGASIVASAWSRPGILSGEEAASALLRAHPRIDAIFCANARDTLGAAQVVVDQNLVGKVLIVGADETPELLRYLEKGVVAASIVRDSLRIGEEALRVFLEMRAGGAPPGTIEVDFSVRYSGGPP